MTHHETKFMVKKTLIRNVGLIFKTNIALFLMIIGLSRIASSEDQMVVLFLTLIWCYIFLGFFAKFRPKLIFMRIDKLEEEVGEIEEW